MAIADCNSPILESGRENQIYMMDAFPIVCYHDDLMRDRVPWHWHDELEFLIVTEGTIIAAEEQNTTAIPTGSGFFVNAGRLHAMWNAGIGPCRLHSMVFSTRLLGSADEVYFSKYLSPMIGNPSLRSLKLAPEIPWQKEMLDAVEQAWELCRDEPEGYEWSVRNALSDAFLQLWKNRPSGQAEDRMLGLRRKRLKMMIQYLEENFEKPLTLMDIASAASVSASEAERCFTAIVRTTPIQFLKDYRLSRAAEFLKSSHDSVTAVAAECGFSDTSYFIRAFRKKYGCTPGEWRLR
jgi:AraC-like DNA-binding protein